MHSPNQKLTKEVSSAELEIHLKFQKWLNKVATSPFHLGLKYSVEPTLRILNEELGFDTTHWFTLNPDDPHSSTLVCTTDWFYKGSTPQDLKNLRTESATIKILPADPFLKAHADNPTQAQPMIKTRILQPLESKDFSRLNIPSLKPYQCAIFIPIWNQNELIGLLELFAKKEKEISQEMLGFFNSVSAELSRQATILKSQENEKQQVFQLALASRLSSLGAMAGGIAHEINNPLTIIMGTIKMAQRYMDQTLVDSVEKNKVMQSLDKARSYTERISKIVKGIRAMSRDASNDPFVWTPTKDIIEDTLNLCEARVKTNNINLTFEWEEDEKSGHSCALECRPIQISQVLLNLINNSMDAIGETNNAWIHLAVKKVNEEILEFSVTDSGTGIPESIANQLMQPFFTTKGTGRGTGLGLSISKEIVQNHHGEFFLNRENPNTQFIVRLPIHQKGVHDTN